MTDHARAALAQEIAETFFGKYLDPKEAGHSARLQHIILAALSRASAAPTTARCHCGGYTFSCCACGSSIHAEQPTPPPAAPSGEQASAQTCGDCGFSSQDRDSYTRHDCYWVFRERAAHPSPAVPPPSESEPLCWCGHPMRRHTYVRDHACDAEGCSCAEAWRPTPPPSD